MINIIHGDDNLTSRKTFADLKDAKSITYDAENLSVVELKQSLQGSGIFESSERIFIENLFGRRAKNAEETIEVINSAGKNTQIYIYADKELPAKAVGQFKDSKAQNFKIPQNIWAFLDGIRPESENNITLFHNALSSNEPEIIFSMLVRQFRLLLGLSGNSSNKIDELKRLAPWQSSKLERQMSIFGQEKIKEIMKKLYKIDRDTKTGKTNLMLTQSIDMLMLEI